LQAKLTVSYANYSAFLDGEPSLVALPQTSIIPSTNNCWICRWS